MHVLSEATPLTSTGIMDLRIVGFRSRLHNHNDRHALQIYAYSVSWLGVELWGGGSIIIGIGIGGNRSHERCTCRLTDIRVRKKPEVRVSSLFAEICCLLSFFGV